MKPTEEDEYDDSAEGKRRRVLRQAAEARFAKAPSVVLPSSYLKPLVPR